MRALAGTLVAGAVIVCRAQPVLAQGAIPPPDFTVAFIGDQGLGADAESVLQLIQDEGADAVVHSGDFDYENDPQAWEDQINGVLGADFPYFASVGNHDDGNFYGVGGYQELLAARMQRLGIPWVGDLGVQSAHHHAGILFVLTAPDVFGAGDGNHDLYIRQRLAEDDAIWRISSWHKNMRNMQVGGKEDKTGWGVYEESRRGAAVIATAHEHSYSRTHLLSSMQLQTVASTGDTLFLALDDPQTSLVDEGRSFAFVSGLGGRSIRDQELSGAWWASIYTSTQNADPGALFGVFHHQGDPRRAYFYFKDVSGTVADAFYVVGAPGLGPACADGLDDDADGLVDFAGGDPGCASPEDPTERDETGAFVCDDGLDNDGDGRTDFDPATAASPGDASSPPAGTGDPACHSPAWPGETSACQDGLDNDGDGAVDYDAGLSFHGVASPGGPDPVCFDRPWRDRESGTRCGLGSEVVLVLMLAPLVRGRRW